MAKSPIQIANIMADAADEKSKNPSPKKKNPKQVAAAKEQEKAKGKKPFPPKGM